MDDEGDTEQKLIQEQMEATRASLSNKLEALENQVADTVQTATDVVQSTKDAVAETVESVKDTVGEISDKVGDTVRSVAHTFDISQQVQERPWLVFGGAIGLGCLVGYYLPTRSREPGVAASRRASENFTPAPPTYQAAAAAPVPAKEPGWVSNQLNRLKGLAIGMVMGTVRDLAVKNLPEAISERVAQEVDNLTPHLGGEVVQGSLLPAFEHFTQATAEATPHEGTTQPGATPEAEGERARAGRAFAGKWG